VRIRSGNDSDSDDTVPTIQIGNKGSDSDNVVGERIISKERDAKDPDGTALHGDCFNSLLGSTESTAWTPDSPARSFQIRPARLFGLPYAFPTLSSQGQEELRLLS
jgi:hypothetical protein